MSNHPELSSAYDTLRLDRDVSSGDTRSAALAVLRRYERGHESAADTLTILQALGLIDTPPAARPVRRSTRQRDMDEKRAQREAEAS